MTLKLFIFHFMFIFGVLFSTTSFSGESHEHNSQKSLLDHQKHAQIIAVVPKEFPPFYHTDEEGLPYGMAIEVMDEIDHNAKVLTKYVVKNSWAEVFKAIDSDEAHIIPNLGITDKRKEKYFFTKPYAKTKITIFTRLDNIISSEAALSDLRVGVVKNNVSVKVAQQRNIKNIHMYDSIKVAFDELLKNNIDAIIFPEIISKLVAAQLNVKHLIHDTGITLKTIDRAIAVSKKHPELFYSINIALNNYLETQDFKDTYTAWYGKKEKVFSTRELIVFNLFVLIFTFLIFRYFWKLKRLSLFSDDDSDNKASNKKNLIWVITLISILIAVTSIVTFSTLWILYNTSFNEQRLRLIDSAKSRARLIEAIARNDINVESELSDNNIQKARDRTIKQVVDAHKNFQGFGETGEFTLAVKIKDNIKFILRQRHSHLVVPKVIPFSSELAAPMRLALLGHSGTIVGKDYRDEQVLAAYEPVSVLNFGIVAKIDLAEIRKPFIRSALYVLTIAILITLLGSLLFFYIIIPIIQKVKETEQRFERLFQDNHSPILLVNPKNAKIKNVNSAAAKFYGYNAKELHSYNLDIFSPVPILKVIQELQLAKNNKYKNLITEHRLQNGDIRNVEILMSPVTIEKETLIQCTIIDITEKLIKVKEHQRLEKDLEQARKMEALGQLTGGIAHDFNNMLGIIMGYTELSQEKLSNETAPSVPGYLENVMTASKRAKELISSMMLFSRTGEGEYQETNISPLVKEDIKMLRSIIPTSIEMNSNINENLPTVLIEPVKLQQLIMNLCVNSRDAMESKGTLTIKLDWQRNVDDRCLISHKRIEGDWIDLSVTDTGSGMTKETLEHLFEPFFTTKQKGKGTGMGMAVVHGIVQDIKGHILVDSKMGLGTTIHILLKPLSQQSEQVKPKVDPIIHHETLNDRILVVDDEISISQLLCDTLEMKGYRCSSFSSSLKALSEFTLHPDNFDLIISDQTMPELTGFDMIKKMRELREDIPVIIATGYSDTFDDTIAKENNITLLAKPLPQKLLLETVYQILK